MRVYLKAMAAIAVVVAMIAASGCRDESASRQVAERFMALYYGEASAARAVALCTGDAARMMRHEIAAMQGVAPATGAERPTVTWNLISHTTPDPTTRTYEYEVVAHAADLGLLTATIVMVQRDDHWLVSSLREQRAPPT